MSRITDDELESALRDVFERQALAIAVDHRAWDDPPLASVENLPQRRRSRSAVAVAVATAAAVALVIGLVAILPASSGVYVAGQPGVPAPVDFTTKYVSLVADTMQIDAGGRQFTAGGSTVSVNSDPGTPHGYTTLELSWTENGVEMRLNMYFTSDAHDWWANEIRTYDGKSPGAWIEYTGTYFRTPLGQTFATTRVDLGAPHGRIRFSNMRLRAFLPPEVCQHPTSRYVLDPSYDTVDIPRGSSGFGLGVTRLLDTATCNPVVDPQTFVYDWTIADPRVARLLPVGRPTPLAPALTGVDPGVSVDLGRIAAGSTTLRVTARERSGGAVVATADIPVTVG